jgi:hypothetical protein
MSTESRSTRSKKLQHHVDIGEGAKHSITLIEEAMLRQTHKQIRLFKKDTAMMATAYLSQANPGRKCSTLS